jgi:hypothetical protein
MEFTIGRTHLVVDQTTGAVTRIEDTVTGLVHVAENPDRFLFRLTVPNGVWTARYADAHFARPRVTQKSDSALHLQWTNLPAKDGTPTGVEVEVRFRADSQTGEIRFEMDVQNNGPDPVTDLHAPMLAGWTGMGGPGEDTLILGGHTRQDPHRFPQNTGTTYAQLYQKGRTDYPVGLYAPWADLSGPGGGLSVINYMEKPQNGTFFEYNAAGHEEGYRLAFGWRTPCVIPPGESWSSPPFGISVHGGDWHMTADRYSDWMDTWFTPPPAKKSLREIIGFQNVWLRGFDGTPFHALDEIPRIAADGRRYGVDQLCIWDEVSLGMYDRQDDRDILAYPPEEKETLRRALRQAGADGTNVNALVNFRLIPASTPFLERYGAESSRLLDGSPHTEIYSGSHNSLCGWTPDRGPTCHICSSFAQSYRERVLRWTEQYLDLGYVSMFYDQPFETTADYGRIADGCRPEDTYAAVCSLVKEVRERLQANDPDAYLIGEYCEAFMSRYIDLWMSWYREVGPARRAAYSIPRTMHSWVVDNDPAQASRAFALGMYLCLCTRGNEGTLADVPAFGEHVHKLATLRRRCADRTVHARFRDNRGLELRTGGAVEAYAFGGAEGPVVIVTAPGEAAAATVTVNREAFTHRGNPDRGRILRLDGSESAVTGETRHFELAANDVAVWLL